MSFSVLFSLVLLATSAVASPTINRRDGPPSLRTAIQIGANSAPGAIIAKDRKRLQALQARGHAPLISLGFADVPITNAGHIFSAEVNVGTPPTAYRLIIDTGSSNTFVGANNPYNPTSSSKDTGRKVSVSYGSGNFSGEEFTDTVTLGDVTINNQSIGVASISQGFDEFDGILGLGPVDLTEGTVKGVDRVPTVTDNLAEHGTIAAALVGISFPPTTKNPNDTGSLDFGIPDPVNFVGYVSYTPITKTSPSSTFWGIDQSVTYGYNKIPILPLTAGIVDTGSTLVYFATEAFQAYANATGATPDKATGLLKIEDPNMLESMFFNIGGETFEFTANAQMWPRSLNLAIGGDSNSTYLIVSDNGTPLGQGMDFINGYAFLQRFYSVYDTTNARVGLATTFHTYDTTN